MSDLDDLRNALAAAGAALDAVVAGGIDSVVLPTSGRGALFTLSTADVPYRMAVESMGEGAATIASDGSIVWANTRLRQMAGRDLVGRSALELATPRDRHDLSALLDGSAADGGRLAFDLAGGAMGAIPVQATLTTFDVDGATLRCLVVADLTEARRAAAESLLAAERRFRDLFEQAPVGLARLSDDGTIWDANPAFANLVGVPSRHLVGTPLASFGLAVPVAGGVAEGHVVSKSGSVARVELSAAPITDGEAPSSSCLLVIRDLTSQRAAESAAAESEFLYRGLIRSLHEGVVRHDADGLVVEANEAAMRILGLREDDLLGRRPDGPPLRLVSADLTPLVAADLPAAVVLRTGAPVLGELIGLDRTPDAPVWILVNAEPVFAADGAELRGVVVSFADVTSLRAVEEELRVANAELTRTAGQDSLTGLPNRAMLLQEADRALAAGRRSGLATGLLLVDVDSFKDINDTLGHQAGDRVLCVVGERLASAVREDDLVCRLGGDEFAVLVRGIASADACDVLAERMVARCRHPVAVDGLSLSATISVGAAVTASASADATPLSLMRDADIALYAAKDQGRDRAHRYTADIGARVDSHVNLERDVRGALDRGELEVWYQPEVSLVDRSIIAVEALVRWRRNDGTVLVAGQFVHALERIGLITELGEWVLGRVCEDELAWSSAPDLGPLKVRVNFGALQFADHRMLGMVDGIRTATGMPARDLCIEVTETVALSRSGTVAANLRGLRERGIELALDDFGTGYGSLSYLHQFAFDTIKIDRSFVSAVSSDARTRDLVGGLIALAQRLGVSVTAEGVESDTEAELLLAMGCLAAQGFLFSPALPVEELNGFRRASRPGRV